MSIRHPFQYHKYYVYPFALNYYFSADYGPTTPDPTTPEPDPGMFSFPCVSKSCIKCAEMYI